MLTVDGGILHDLEIEVRERPVAREADTVAAVRRRKRVSIASPPTRAAYICGTALLCLGTVLVVFAGLFWWPFLVFSSPPCAPETASAYYQNALYSAVLGIPGLAAGIMGWRLRSPRRQPSSDVSDVFD